MNDELALAFARQAARHCIERQSYLPATTEEAAAFEPHLWVLDALKMMYRRGLEDGVKK